MNKILDNLNEEQKQAVLHEDGPAMVLAGAGSGKTTVLTARATHLLSTQKTQPNSILLVTFTNKAAGEIKSRIGKMANQNIPNTGTFHSIAAKLLRINGHFIGLKPNFSILDSDDQKKLLQAIIKSNAQNGGEIKVGTFISLISKAKNEMLSPSEFEERANSEYEQRIASAYTQYQKRLEQMQAVDFDDLLLKALRVLKNVPDVRERYQHQFEHILVDEYQDTNKVQYELTKILSKLHHNLYVVGDFSQSIYSWRGADYRNMLALETDFPDIKKYQLEQNYRSTQNILDTATRIISHNTKHPILSLWTAKTGGAKLVIIDTETGRDEARVVAQKIRELADKIPLNEFAILYRTNAQSREFEEALIRSNISYQLIGGTKFYERKEVKDVLSFLAYLDNPLNTISEKRAMGLGKRRFQKFLNWLEEKGRDQLLKLNPQELIKQILETTGYLDKYSGKNEEDIDRKENIYELINVASQFGDLRQFLENIALIQNGEFVDVVKSILGNEGDNQKPLPKAQAVNLMSLHAAKGLEFEVVFMVGMEEGLLPHSRSMFNEDEMEEERRLCYVGITRAKSQLFMTKAQKRFQYGTSQQSVGSRFLHDIPRELIRHEGDLTQNQACQSAPGRRIVIDDDLLEGALSGEIDFDKFIDS